MGDDGDDDGLQQQVCITLFTSFPDLLPPSSFQPQPHLPCPIILHLPTFSHSQPTTTLMRMGMI